MSCVHQTLDHDGGPCQQAEEGGAAGTGGGSGSGGGNSCNIISQTC